MSEKRDGNILNDWRWWLIIIGVVIACALIKTTSHPRGDADAPREVMDDDPQS